jgi:RNA polymerase sigma factor (sigma-70 family)
MASETTGSDEPAGLDHILKQCDTLILRSAHRASRYIIGNDSIAEDLAQDVRFHLARALEEGRIEEKAIRRLITNALRDRIRFEGSRIQLTSPEIAELDDRNTALGVTNSATRPEVLTVARWVASLPDTLRSVFNLIYRGGYTQREACSVLGLSQPRITQLHQELLKRGRLELAAPAA